MPLGESPDWTEGCPGQPILAAYSLGKLSGEMVERVATHVSGCTRCEALLPDTAAENDSLVQNLRRCVAQGGTSGDNGLATTEPRLTAADVKAIAGAEKMPLPARLGQYELLEQLGRGGMGVVYKARQVPLNRVVALKLALCGPVPGTEAFTRFQAESAVIARLQHDNIVRVYECGEHEGRPYFSMDYVEGGSLAERLSGKPLPEREAASLVQTLARAVQFAHRRHVIHRDLKPGNVLIGPDGVVKLTDFGLAKLLDADDGQTQSYVVMGTAAYMAPEQARGDTREVGPAADVYGLGAILYEALTGRPPFKGATRAQTLEHVRSQEPLLPSRLRPRMSRDLEAVCLKCLAKEPKKRYASAEALAEDLARWLRGEPTLARPRRWPARAYRSARKHPVAVLLGALILCGSVLPPVLNRQPPVQQADPDLPLKEIEQALGQGQPVTLIGEAGQPAWFRWCAGEEKTRVSLAADGTFAVHSWTLCLLELVRDPQQDRYRVRAEVRHENSDTLGPNVGLYVAHRAYPGAGADIHLLTQFGYNDVRSRPAVYKRLPPDRRTATPPEDVNLVELFPCMQCAGIDGGGGWDDRIEGVSGVPFKPAGVGGGPWRQLEVTVTPERLRATWDGQLVGDLPVPKIVDRLGAALARRRRWYPDDPFVGQIPAYCSLRGSLGLFVYSGSARFRSVRIEPLMVSH